MAADDPSGGDAPANGGAGQVALLSDPVDVIIDKLLRCVQVVALNPQFIFSPVPFVGLIRLPERL